MPTFGVNDLPALVVTNMTVDTRVNILIVDDEPKNLTVLESVLDDPGYRLVRASSGEQALLALIADEFAVLVLDVRMPDMTGFELANLVRERRKTSRIPIIFLTAYYNEDQHILEGYDSGAVDYLHKPVNARVLRSKVAVFAELDRKRRALEAANFALENEVAERRIAEKRLNELNESLDRRVTERTSALNASEAQLRDTDRRKDEFLATLAHELRNPLAPVRNAAQVLRLKSTHIPELHAAVEIIDRQVRSMSRLIDDLMDVSRIKQGKIALQLKCVDLAQVLHDAVETSRPIIDECGHRLVNSVKVQEVFVDADPTRMVQVFMNLLTNAAKYMDSGGLIELSAYQKSGEVFVSVKDTGIGIAPDRLASVFEMFSQVDTALSRSHGGLGIGLSLTQKLVEMHSGTVTAQSQGLGHGSEFVVKLPLKNGKTLSTQENLKDKSTEPLNKPQSSSVRILVADDNVDTANSLQMLLEIMGHTVMKVHDGASVIGAVRDFDPQLILLDIGMPHLNGYEACRHVRKDKGGADRIIVAITGWGQPSDLHASRDAGFDHHFVKPFDPDLLTDLLQNLNQSG